MLCIGNEIIFLSPRMQGDEPAESECHNEVLEDGNRRTGSRRQLNEESNRITT